MKITKRKQQRCADKCPLAFPTPSFPSELWMYLCSCPLALCTSGFRRYRNGYGSRIELLIPSSSSTYHSWVVPFFLILKKSKLFIQLLNPEIY